MSDRIMFTRREFLRTASVLAVGATIPRFLVEFASAAQTGVIPGFSDDRILVVVQLAGGNDGLNTVVPYADDAYYRARPTLAQPKEKLLRVDDHVAFHPKLAPLADLLQKQYLTIVEGVGYPNPNRSHFRSMEIWQTASDSREYLTTGWVGRYLDAACSGEAKPVAGVSIGGEMPLAMVGKRGLAVTVQDLESFGWKTAENTAPPEALLQLNHALSKTPRTRGRLTAPTNFFAQDNLSFLRQVIADAAISTDLLRRVSSRSGSSVTYPNDPFAQGLATISKMIASGLPTRIYYVSLTGFDTHSNQLGTHERLLDQFAKGLAAFWQDLEAQGNAERVLVMTFSEFGRRVAENGSQGTDHGTAQPMFLIGKVVRPGFAGARPSLTDLEAGDLKFTTDFRSVYATVLEKWLGTSSETVLGKKFAQLPIIQKHATVGQQATKNT
ncbi:MAG: DUF1501 domain-containing protein [Candidatus Sumerlaea chitinivorans]|nr:DUF1501 domain-containing protein [Candidatus Sumerlaea chitinivorans]